MTEEKESIPEVVEQHPLSKRLTQASYLCLLLTVVLFKVLMWKVDLSFRYGLVTGIHIIGLLFAIISICVAPAELKAHHKKANRTPLIIHGILTALMGYRFIKILIVL